MMQDFGRVEMKQAFSSSSCKKKWLYLKESDAQLHKFLIDRHFYLRFQLFN